MSIERVKDAMLLLDECIETLRSKSTACQDDMIIVKWAIVKDVLIKLEKASFILENQINVERTNIQ